MENMPILIYLVGSESNENACQPCNDDCYESVFDEAPTCINADAQGHGCNFVQTDSLIDMHVRQDGHVTAKQLSDSASPSGSCRASLPAAGHLAGFTTKQHINKAAKLGGMTRSSPPGRGPPCTDQPTSPGQPAMPRKPPS